jgi:L-ascorbate metabolism protein UlaG (beta-lactamase superfamily)
MRRSPVSALVVVLMVVMLGVGAGVAVSGSGAAAAGNAADAGATQANAVRLEYIAHAAFVIESPGGTRVVIDPYNGNIWLGYGFPEGIEADAVVVSHPHYDHDATYYFSDVTPVLRSPGKFRFDDVTLVGVESEHAGRSRFLDRGQTPYNTIWVAETGGLRIAHLGDNRFLNEVDLERLGAVDVVLLGAAYLDGINGEMLALLVDTAHPQLLVPMHYQQPGLSDLPRGMRPVTDYMEGREALYVDGNVLELTAAGFAQWPEVVVLKPSPAVQPWSDELYDAWIEANEGAVLLADSETEADAARAEEALWEGLFHFESAMDLASRVLRFGYGAADALARLGEINDAIETLDHAVARAPRADWTERARAHMLLGELYEAGDRPDIAVEHYLYVAAQEHTHETSMRDRALQRLEELRQNR